MEVRIDAQPDHLRVVILGGFDPLAARTGIAQIISTCEERGLDRVLVDGRGITTAVSVLERYELAKTIAEGTKRRLRLAVVVTRENMFSKTLEHTARNMGMDVRTTDSMAEAMTYLGLPLTK